MDSAITLYLDAVHKNHQAKMGPFAGYTMPISYPEGIIGEHNHVREKAGLFDISHMGQVHIAGSQVEAYMDMLVPIACSALKTGESKYTVMLNEQAGIIDDLIITRKSDTLFAAVINAACREKDLANMYKVQKQFSDITIEVLDDRVLLALQGPMAVEIISTYLAPYNTSNIFDDIIFMQGLEVSFENEKIWMNRSGYTGEDGVEMSVPHSIAKQFVEGLLQNENVKLIGLGARNTLRLEAGLLLYGHDMDEETNIYEAKLSFAITKARLEDESKFVGKESLKAFSLMEPKNRKKSRVGLLPSGKAPIREGVLLYASESDNPETAESIGVVCSGGLSPTLGKPIAMAYVQPAFAKLETVLWAHLRNKMIAVEVSKSLFITHKYKR